MQDLACGRKCLKIEQRRCKAMSAKNKKAPRFTSASLSPCAVEAYSCLIFESVFLTALFTLARTGECSQKMFCWRSCSRTLLFLFPRRRDKRKVGKRKRPFGVNGSAYAEAALLRAIIADFVARCNNIACAFLSASQLLSTE